MYSRGWLFLRLSLIGLGLLAPIFESVLIERREIYQFAGHVSKKTFYVHDRIYDELPPVDYLFIGSSGVFVSVNAKVIENHLRSRFHRDDISVENFGFNEVGTDLYYFFVRELVRTRGVRRIFLSLPEIPQWYPHPIMRVLWDVLDAPEDLPLKIRSQLYAEKILEAPATLGRHFLDRPEKNFEFYLTNGTMLVDRGYRDSENEVNPRESFVPVDQNPVNVTLKDVVIPRDSRLITHPGSFTSYQNYFFEKIIELARKERIELYFLLTPQFHPTVDPHRFQVLKLGPQVDPSVSYIGITGARLFGTTDPERIKLFFYNHNHPNVNGNLLYTKTLIPVLEEMYEKQDH